jgi:dUTP pyrophosphatase
VINGNLKGENKMKFEKVSEEEFKKRVIELFGGDELDEVMEKFRNMKLPSRSTASSAGYDFYIPFGISIRPGETFIIPTGVKVKLDPDKVLMIAPRSSIGIKKHLRLANTQAYIDADYYNNPDNEGHMWLSLQNHGDRDFVCKKGCAFGQGVFTKFLVTDDDDASGSRVSGIGSTTKEG